MAHQGPDWRRRIRIRAEAAARPPRNRYDDMIAAAFGQSLTESLARIRAVVEAGKRIDEYDDAHGEVSGQVLSDFARAYDALTPDDRRLLGMPVTGS